MNKYFIAVRRQLKVDRNLLSFFFFFDSDGDVVGPVGDGGSVGKSVEVDDDVGFFVGTVGGGAVSSSSDGDGMAVVGLVVVGRSVGKSVEGDDV